MTMTMKHALRLLLALLLAVPAQMAAAAPAPAGAEKEPEWLLQVDATTDLFISDFHRGFPSDRLDADTLSGLVNQDLEALKSTKEVLQTLSAPAVRELEGVMSPLAETDRNVALAPYETRAARWVQDILRAHDANEVDAIQIYLFTRMLAEPENRRPIWILLESFRDEKLDDYYRTRIASSQDYRFNIAKGVGYSLVAWWVFALLPTRFKSKRTFGQLVERTAGQFPRLWERARLRRILPSSSRLGLEGKATARAFEKIATRNAPANYPRAASQPYNPRHVPSTVVVQNGQPGRPAAITRGGVERVRPKQTWWQSVKNRFWGMLGYSSGKEAPAAVAAAPAAPSYNPRQVPSPYVVDPQTGRMVKTSPRVVAEPIPPARVQPKSLPKPIANAFTNMKTNFVVEFLKRPRQEQMKTIAKFLALHTAGAVAYGVPTTLARRSGWWMLDDVTVLPQEEMDQYVADALILQFQCRVRGFAQSVNGRRYDSSAASVARYKADAADLYNFYDEYAFLKVIGPTKYSKHVVSQRQHFINGDAEIRYDAKSKNLTLIRDYANQTVTESWSCPSFRTVGNKQVEVSLAEGLVDLEAAKYQLFKARLNQKVARLNAYVTDRGAVARPQLSATNRARWSTELAKVPASIRDAAKTIVDESMNLSNDALQEFIHEQATLYQRGNVTAGVLLAVLQEVLENSDRFGFVESPAEQLGATQQGARQ